MAIWWGCHLVSLATMMVAPMLSEFLRPNMAYNPCTACLRYYSIVIGKKLNRSGAFSFISHLPPAARSPSSVQGQGLLIPSAPDLFKVSDTDTAWYMYKVYSVHVQCTVCSVQCTVYSVVYSAVQCTV